MKAMILTVGNVISQAALGAGYALALLVETLLYVWTSFQRRQLREILHQMFVCGIASIPVTMVVSVFTGAILALNGGLSLSQFGQENLIGGIVAVSMTREMGPFMTALILAASVGAGMAAELGTMKVSEEIDALEVMGLNSVRYLVVPKYLALLAMMPCLTVFSDAAGIMGGGAFTMYQLEHTYPMFLTATREALVMRDISTGLLKSLVFGLVITTVGCYEGFSVQGGAEGVGKSTTSSVVVSIFLIILTDVIFTAIFYYTG